MPKIHELLTKNSITPKGSTYTQSITSNQDSSNGSLCFTLTSYYYIREIKRIYQNNSKIPFSKLNVNEYRIFLQEYYVHINLGFHLAFTQNAALAGYLLTISPLHQITAIGDTIGSRVYVLSEYRSTFKNVQTVFIFNNIKTQKV